MPDVFIFGSCVSRDIYSRLAKFGFGMIDYVARQSLVSADAPADSRLIDSDLFDSKFQLSSIRSDFDSDLWGRAESVRDADLVLMDLVDERNGCLELSSGGIVTNNWELACTGQKDKLDGFSHLPLGSERHLRLWRRSFDCFLDLLERHGKRDRLLVLRPQFVELSGGDGSFGADAVRALTNSYRPYVDYIVSRGIALLEVDDSELAAGEEHRWGPAPFHFADSTEIAFMNRVVSWCAYKGIVPTSQKRGRIDLGVSGPFSVDTDFVSSGGRRYYIDRTKHMVVDHRSVAAFMSASEVCNGFHVIADSRGRGEPIVLLNQDRGCDTTAVFFHAAIGSDFTLPVVSGLGFSRDVEVNRVFVSDPSLVNDSSLNLSWFAGTLGKHLEHLIDDVIGKVLASHRTARRVVFFGASGGGFAALLHSSRFDQSIALVANPQTDIRRYDRAAYSKFVQSCFGGESGTGGPRHGCPLSVTEDLTSVYANELRNSVVYLQNDADSSHIEFQLRPLLARIHPSNDFHLLVQHWGDGHVAPPADFLTKMLSACAGEDWRSRIAELGCVPVFGAALPRR